nr:retrovirus-related Pol polyprotein from transposon TNT 1-94 [Tanacetum cinerariifolium]
MLEKDMYDSWRSRMEMYMLNRQHDRIILESVEHGPLLWPSVTEEGVTRLKKYSKLSAAEAFQADCDKGETLRDFYLRFSLLLNEMNMYYMKLEQFQVNTKFLNTLPPEWSKFVTDVKLLNMPTYQHHHQSYQQPQFQQQASTYQSLPYTTSYHTPQFVSQGSSSSNLSISYPMNDTSLTVNHNAYMASAPQIDYAPIVHHLSECSLPETRLVVPVFQKGDDPIDAINHMMSFLTSVVTSKSQQAATKNRDTTIVNSPPPIYDQEPTLVAEDDEMSKDKEIDKLMALISLSFKKIYKPTNNNLKTSSNTSKANQDNTLRINRGTGYNKQRVVNVTGARENVDQELEAHYMYMAQIQEVTPDATENSRPIFDVEPLQKEQGNTNITIDLLYMCANGDTVDQDVDDLTKELDLLASLIEKLKCKIDDSKNRNKFLETSNKALVDKLKGEIEDFKTKNKSLESSNNHIKEANNELSKTNQLMFKDLKKFQAKLDRYLDVNYVSKVAIDCAKAKGDLMSYKIESEKSLMTILERKTI